PAVSGPAMALVVTRPSGARAGRARAAARADATHWSCADRRGRPPHPRGPAGPSGPRLSPDVGVAETTDLPGSLGKTGARRNGTSPGTVLLASARLAKSIEPMTRDI